jgi:Fe-S oxidoreductase
VGKCRDTADAGAQLMCPSFLATRDEKDTTRGRARVLQEMIAGRHRPDWRASEVHDALDLCLSCKGCATDCPTGTDMAKYKAEVLHQAYRHRIRPRTHYSLGRLPTWARLASHMPRLANAALQGPVGGLGRAAAGVDPRRDLPAFASETFRAWFDKRPASRIGDPLVLWVDTFTNHFDPGIGKAAVRVLEGVGYAVQIPERQVCCGLTYLSTGQLDKARNRLRKSLQVLEPASHTGVPIVALEPSCAAVFRDDAAELLGSLDHPGLRMRTLAELLSGRSPQIPDLTERSIVAQPHCHHRSVMGWDPDRRLLRATGGSVDSVAGCCGLAGNFGAERGHFETSLAVAETYLLPAIARLPSDGVVVADGFSCRTQIMQFTSRRALHTAELLAGELPPRP